MEKVGEAIYELELPKESKLHNTFHVSLLKKTMDQHDISSTTLPPLDDEGWLVLIPERVLET